MIRETLADIGRAGPRVRDWGLYSHLALLIAVATVPAMLAGVIAGGIEDRLRTPGVVAAMLVLVGIAMAAAERWSSYVAQHRLYIVVWYRVALAAVVLMVL